MSEIYFSSTNMWGSNILDTIKLLKEYEIDGIELWAEQVTANNYLSKQYLMLASQYGIKTLVHSKSWDLNFASLNDCIRRASIEEVKNSILLAEELSSKEITIHPPRETICGFKQDFIQRAYEGLCEIYEFSLKVGVKISIEILEKIPKELVTTPEELKLVTKDLYDELSYTLDIAHCRDEEEFFEYLNIIPNISKLHISNKIGDKLHTTLPNGDFDFNTLFEKINKTNIPIVVEGFGCGSRNKNVMENLEFIKKLKENEKCH